MDRELAPGELLRALSVGTTDGADGARDQEAEPRQAMRRPARPATAIARAAAAIALAAGVALGGAVVGEGGIFGEIAANPRATDRLRGSMETQGDSDMRSRKFGSVAMLGATAAATVTIGALAGDAVQWRVADGGNGHWYALTEPGVNWHACAAEALARGGHLATLTSAAETTFAASAADGENVSYIGARQDAGASDPFGGWRWVTDEAWGYETWHFNMDDAPCGHDAGPGEQQYLWMHNAVRQWDDVNDVDFPRCPLPAKRGIIEWDADCNGDGIADYGQCRDGSLPDYNGNNIPDCCENGSPCAAGTYPVQWRIEDGGNGHWYQGVPTNAAITWNQAKNRALSSMGHLATLASREEDLFVARLAIGNAGVWATADRYGPWLGGYQPVPSSNPYASWAWVTGEPWTYVSDMADFDNSTRPDGQRDDYLHYIDHVRKWNDVREDGDIYYGIGIRSYMIEWDADCNNDGLVDYGQILTGQLADADPDGIPDICQQPTCRDADLFPNGVVNGADLGILLSQWGVAPSGTVSDINRDGAVNGADLALLLSFWGPCS